MTQLNKDRNTPARAGEHLYKGVAALAHIFAGSLVAMNAGGFVVPGSTATGLTALGRAEEQVDNSDGGNGDRSVRIAKGVFRYANSASGDAITDADIGNACYIVDDQTVAKTDGGSTRSPAGIVDDVDAQGVWVKIGFGPAAASGALLAASNLSDVGAKPTARSNLGVAEKMGAPAIVVGAENTGAGTINVAIQLKDSAGADLAVRGGVLAYLSDDAAGDTVAGTAPDGGWAIGTDGMLIPLVADKTAMLVSEADGDIDITITESGADTWYLILVMPDGKLVASDAITFAE